MSRVERRLRANVKTHRCEKVLPDTSRTIVPFYPRSKFKNIRAANCWREDEERIEQCHQLY
jgi:hypothetical protein